jgi:hypothetical protein
MQLRLQGGHFRNLCLTHPNIAIKVIRVLGHPAEALEAIG